MDDILEILITHVLPHWPILVVAAIFTVMGQFFSKSVFTRSNAYKKRKGPWYKFWDSQWFWWWGRETLSIHPILTGTLLGLIWQNPESADPAWPLVASIAYFAGAGVVSLFTWSLVKGYLKQKGVNLTLPGRSVPPTSDD